MTQPAIDFEKERRKPHWIQGLIDRYKEQERGPGAFQPVGFEFNRPAFDPSSYYRDYDFFRQISAQATRSTQEAVERRRQEELQEYLRSQQAPINAGTPLNTGSVPLLKNTGSGKLGRPLANYRVTSGYGHRHAPTKGASSFHGGIDMAAGMGTPIYATHDGYVGQSGWNGGYGNSVTINGAGGIQTFYAHNSKNAVKPGQRVKRGQVIGYVGSTGVSTGPHLHYEVWINGKKVNPAGYL